MALILGIESSCDETAAAVFCTVRRQILASHVFSQIALHQAFGGVLPEVASRSHVEKIDLIVQAALDDAKIMAEQLDLIAVTNHPGLIGSLLVGVCFAKGLAYALDKPIVGINHNHGHILSSLLDDQGAVREQLPFPHLCISLSGGHSSIFLVQAANDYQLLGSTLDDAAGEAFDKISKLMGLGYPGGPIIEKLAGQVGFKDFFNYPRTSAKNKQALNFSFSGLKTAVLYHLVGLGAVELATQRPTALLNLEMQQQVASSLLVCVTDIVLQKLKLALAQQQIKAVTLVGGVACNQFIAGKVAQFCQQKGLEFFTPARQFCTDNGAMIALAGAARLAAGNLDDLYLDVVRHF